MDLIEDNENNYKEGEDVELRRHSFSKFRPFTVGNSVLEASFGGINEFWERRSKNERGIKPFDYQTNFDALTRPKPYGANGRPLSMKPE